MVSSADSTCGSLLFHAIRKVDAAQTIAGAIAAATAKEPPIDACYIPPRAVARPPCFAAAHHITCSDSSGQNQHRARGLKRRMAQPPERLAPLGFLLPPVAQRIVEARRASRGSDLLPAESPSVPHISFSSSASARQRSQEARCASKLRPRNPPACLSSNPRIVFWLLRSS